MSTTVSSTGNAQSVMAVGIDSVKELTYTEKLTGTSMSNKKEDHPGKRISITEVERVRQELFNKIFEAMKKTELNIQKDASEIQEGTTVKEIRRSKINGGAKFVGNNPAQGKEIWILYNGDMTIGIHPRQECSEADQECAIHDPSYHHMRKWSLTFQDGQLWRVCGHGSRHLDPDEVAFREKRNQPAQRRCLCDCDCCASS